MEKRRGDASRELSEKWAWQKDAEGKDLLGEWRARRSSGAIESLDGQYGGERKGGIPLPVASFGVGGEFGVGGKYDK